MAVDTAKILQERRDIDFSNRIAELEPDAGPLTVLLKKISKTTVDTAEYRWFESERNARWAEFDGSDESSPGTTITLVDTSILRPNELLKNPRTGEVLLVTSITDATTASVRRGYGSTAAANMKKGDALLIMNNAQQEY